MITDSGLYVKEYAEYAMVFDCEVDMESLEVVRVFSEMNPDEEIKREYVVIGRKRYPVGYADDFEEFDYDGGVWARWVISGEYGVLSEDVLLRW